MSKRMKDTVMVLVKTLPRYYAQALKTTQHLNQDAWIPVQGFNLAPSDWKYEVLPLLRYGRRVYGLHHEAPV